MDKAQRLSTEHVIRVAKVHFKTFSSHDRVDMCMLNNFFTCASFGFSAKEIKDVELAILLLVSAKKVSNRDFHEARKLLQLCGFLSSNTGNSVQRLVYYCTRALQEKINRETGMANSKSAGSKEPEVLHTKLKAVSPDAAKTNCYLKLPFVTVTSFPGIQAIVESLASARKVHLIKFTIRNGAACVTLMQALATQRDRLLEHFKVTAVETSPSEETEETGRRLACVANALNIHFSFKSVLVAHIEDLSTDISFDSRDDEAIAVYAACVLRDSLAQQDCLESVIKVLKNLNPSIVVIIEVEANHISPIFMERFFEALSFYGAVFDCVEDHMNRCDPYRMTLEASIWGPEMQQIVINEDEDRILWHMSLDTRRARLTNFALVETELSSTSLLQAEMLINMFACGNSCTINRNGKSLVTSWKGTPLFSVSAWKFK